ncbi:hypothetical protein T4C_1352 [Trichinella pseudospiralis]|uniref:Uncharacterized protein n=1 Tax=Trichinella pseudospiralis TaxID=6337 RepID=A0A0V1JPH4_TRIPS|nr:hypothetical protein T4C_1352 [Trichinella pseudospiralis]
MHLKMKIFTYFIQQKLCQCITSEKKLNNAKESFTTPFSQAAKPVPICELTEIRIKFLLKN